LRQVDVQVLDATLLVLLIALLGWTLRARARRRQDAEAAAAAQAVRAHPVGEAPRRAEAGDLGGGRH